MHRKALRAALPGPHLPSLAILVLLTSLATLLCEDASAGTVTGRTQGAFAVSPTGAAIYTIPIWAPPGPQGMQPHIALNYNSQQESDSTVRKTSLQGTGYLGVGWSLAGLSSIYRCNLTDAQDASAAPIALAGIDGYCLDGQRLRLTSAAGTYGKAGSTYQTEIADFRNVTANGAAGNGPSYFTVQDRNGRTYTYGNGGSSQVLATGSTTAITWMLNEVSDPSGNTMTISYNTANGAAVPATISWTPSSHGSTTYNYTMTFAYSGNVPQSSVYKYVAGTSLVNTNLLSSITIDYTGAVVKKYVLSYQQAPTPTGTGRNRLIQVEECSDSGGTNCLLPTTISYQNGTAGVSTSASTFTMGSAATGWYLPQYDLNGDGYKDLIFQIGTTWYVAFGSATGFGTPISTGITTPTYGPGHGQLLVGDLTGSGQDGLLANNGGTWYYYTWNNSTNKFNPPVSTGVPYDASAYAFALADTNGDGLPDLVSLNPGVIYIRLNTSGSSPSFSAPYTAFNVPPVAGFDYSGGQFVTPDTQAGGPLRRFDFNGDGRDDLQVLIAYYDGADKIHYHTRYWLLGNGTTFTASQTTDLPTVFVNWNDDACTDHITGSSLIISACNGSPGATINLGYTPLTSMDWDGDGRTDLVYESGGYLYVQLSTGNNQPGATINTGIPYNANAFNYWGADINGDGLDELLLFVENSGTLQLKYYPHNGAGQKPDLATSITDGYGNSASPTYVSLVQHNYTQGTVGSGSGGYYPYTKPLYVTSQVVFSDPSTAGGTFNQQFWYYTGIENITGRGFQGFDEVSTFDSRNSLYDDKYYLTTFPYSGTLSKEILSTGGSSYIRQATGSNAVVVNLSTTQYQERYFPYFSDWAVQQWEVGGTEAGDSITTSVTGYQFDNYGNPTQITTTVTDNDPGSPYKNDSWTTTTTNTPDVDTTHWCLGLFTKTVVAYSDSISSSHSVTRTKNFTPDTTNCRYNEIVTEPGSTQYKVTEDLFYDQFGNLNIDKVTGLNMTARQTTINWTSTSPSVTTGQFPMNVTDASGAYSQLNYDFRYGLTSSITDPNGLITSWAYGDGFGRQTKQTNPDGTAINTTYTSCSANSYCPGTSKLEIDATLVDKSNNYIREVQAYPDSVDRPIQQFVRNQNAGSGGNSWTVTGWKYDALGRLAGRGIPILAGGNGTVEPFVTYHFDVLNRIENEQRPISSTNNTLQTTTYQYAGRTTTITDPNLHTKTLVNDVNGWLRRTKDATGYYVTIAYDAFGSKTSVTDSLGNSLWSTPTTTPAYAYGIAPMLLNFTDADLGNWTATYDALGETTGWTDAKGQHFSAKYDALSRLTDRYEPDLYSHWVWGNSTANHNWGRLANVCTGIGTDPTSCTGSGYSESENYDPLARLSQRSIVIPGDRTYTYAWSYNGTTGLLDTLTYPATASGYALKVQYGYSNGFVASITDTSNKVALWTANTANAVDGQDHFLQETLGNGAVVNHTFDSVTGWVSSITAGVGGGAALQNNSYLFDKVGNLTQRQDNNAGVTENVYPDSLNRLDHTVGDTSTVMAYDSMGRLYQWGASGVLSNTNDYTTPQAGCSYYANAQPHAVRKGTSGSHWTTFCYDGNGNLAVANDNYTPSDRTSLTWTSYNQPLLISNNNSKSSSQFSYDHNHQRWLHVASYSGSTERTEYIGGLLELMSNTTGTAYRYYVPVGNNYIVYNRWNSSSNPCKASNLTCIYYVTSDHLGSTAVITDPSGALVVKEKFSALGWNENTTAEEATMATVTRHEYTGHEGLDQNGLWLVNMNGRIYMPSGSMMFSPDPYVQDPTNTISYNRYAYANYNPLTYVDPTGFDDACAVTNPGDDGGDGGGGGGDGGGNVEPDAVRPRAKDATSCSGGQTRENAGNVSNDPQTWTGTRLPGGPPPPNLSCGGNCGMWLDQTLTITNLPGNGPNYTTPTLYIWRACDNCSGFMSGNALSLGGSVANSGDSGRSPHGNQNQTKNSNQFQQCVNDFLRTNYGSFFGGTVVPDFSYVSIATNFSAFVQGSLLTGGAKGALLYGPRALGSLYTTTGTNLAQYPGMATASADALETGAFWTNTGATASRIVLPLYVFAAAFSTTADVVARASCAGWLPL